MAGQLGKADSLGFGSNKRSFHSASRIAFGLLLVIATAIVEKETKRNSSRLLSVGPDRPLSLGTERLGIPARTISATPSSSAHTAAYAAPIFSSAKPHSLIVSPQNSKAVAISVSLKSTSPYQLLSFIRTFAALLFSFAHTLLSRAAQ